MSKKKTELGEEEYMQKNVAFYQTFLSAWVQNRMEFDKQLLTLSSLAIGLLMLFHEDLKTLPFLILWLITGISFITTIIIILRIFKNNPDYIEYIIAEDGVSEAERKVIEEKRIELEKSLQKHTEYAFITFIIGIILTLSLVVVKSGIITITITM